MCLNKKIKERIDLLKNNNEMLKQIKEDISYGVERQYPGIKQLYAKIENNILPDGFTSKFTSFYRVHGVLDRNNLFDFIAKKKQQPIGSIIKRIANPKRRCSHLSFASKALHTINNDLPIYDSFVGQFFGLADDRKEGRANMTFDEKVLLDCKIYERLLAIFNEYKQNGLSELVTIFNTMYPNTNFSDVKKIDFVIWGNGRVEEQKKLDTNKPKSEKSKKMTKNMATEVICKKGDLFAVTQVEGIAIFVPEGLTAIRCNVKDYIERVSGEQVCNGVYKITNGSLLKLIVTNDVQCDNVEMMQNELVDVLDTFKKENVRSIAMNGIRCDNRPDTSIRPETYQKNFIEKWIKDNPNTFDRIELVDLRGGFNRD